MKLIQRFIAWVWAVVQSFMSMVFGDGSSGTKEGEEYKPNFLEKIALFLAGFVIFTLLLQAVVGQLYWYGDVIDYLQGFFSSVTTGDAVDIIPTNPVPGSDVPIAE